MPLHVALNALHLVPGETGGQELYARRLIPALLAAEGDLRLTVLASREGAPSLGAEPWANGERARVVELPVRSRSRIARVAAEQALLPAAVLRARADLLHNLFTTAPALPGVGQVTTVLDLIYKRVPGAHRGLLGLGMAALVPLAAARSRRVIAISRSVADDVVRWLGVPGDRLDVVPLGPGLSGTTPPLPEAELRRRHGLGDAPLVLSVSARRPHKNLPHLVEALSRLRHTPSPLLVLPGYPTGDEGALLSHARAHGVGDRVRLLDWVDEATLEGLYRASTCMVFPSLAEGFGLPVLEAMVRGLPVACSDRTSLPEVAGDAALYFDPEDVGGIAAAMGALLGDGELRGRLAAAGLARAGAFTWEATARGTLASYRRALERGRR